MFEQFLDIVQEFCVEDKTFCFVLKKGYVLKKTDKNTYLIKEGKMNAQELIDMLEEEPMEDEDIEWAKKEYERAKKLADGYKDENNTDQD